MNFTESQNRAFSKFLNGENIFITGPGGCGKSYFIKEIFRIATSQGKNISVTSLTGCSAILLNCKATTIHKWGYLGLGKGEEMTIYRKIVKKSQTANYIDTEILVIDEISMLNQHLFEVLDFLCKKIRKCDLPFGGIQIVASGDFFQLPPVCIDNEDISQSNFCFQSTLWEQTFDKKNHFSFDVNFRQNDDPKFFEILQEIRKGSPSFDTISTLVECSIKKYNDDENTTKPTRIFPIKKMVDKINQCEIEKMIQSSPEQCEYKVSLKHSNVSISNKFIKEPDVKNEVEHVTKNGVFEQSIILCIGCQVMCIANIDQELGLVNGSQGVVTSFVSESGTRLPVVKFDNIENEITVKPHKWIMERNEKYSLEQIPLVLSWAITIHKSQGMSIEKAVIDIGSSVFQYGQTYVALSRVKSLGGLFLTKVNAQKIRAHPEVIKFYKSLESTNIVGRKHPQSKN